VLTLHWPSYQWTPCLTNYPGAYTPFAIQMMRLPAEFAELIVTFVIETILLVAAADACIVAVTIDAIAMACCYC